ncbi:hypothetical protein [Spiroplasma endosymbiont of Polydrusus cervinus]|uniref:hypothetical protein n=1 Tax=Spiroplasma endosymbiont of Polydrusus cervinus TaxID=3066287 RepID=UPI0030D19451
MHINYNILNILGGKVWKYERLDFNERVNLEKLKDNELFKKKNGTRRPVRWIGKKQLLWDCFLPIHRTGRLVIILLTFYDLILQYTKKLSSPCSSLT